MADSPASHKDKTGAHMGGPSLPELLNGSHGSLLVQGDSWCRHHSPHRDRAGTVSVGHHSWYRDLWMGQGCAAGMETANNMRNTARMETQLEWGHMQGDSVEPWVIVMLQDKG